MLQPIGEGSPDSTVPSDHSGFGVEEWLAIPTHIFVEWVWGLAFQIANRFAIVISSQSCSFE
ncbi:MAG: hypothetical protein R2932_53120 [Caldilineaceae bacterium]